jgi:hypothetical protein
MSRKKIGFFGLPNPKHQWPYEWIAAMSRYADYDRTGILHRTITHHREEIPGAKGQNISAPPFNRDQSS